MANSIPMLPYNKLRSTPSIALLLMRIRSKIIGIITGKLKMAIKVPLLPALEAMAEIIVKTVEKLILPKSTAKK